MKYPDDFPITKWALENIFVPVMKYMLIPAVFLLAGGMMLEWILK